MFKLDLSNISPSNFECVPRYIYDTLQWLMHYYYFFFIVVFNVTIGNYIHSKKLIVEIVPSSHCGSIGYM